MKKHFGNMISWSACFINIFCLILILNDILPIQYLVLTIFVAAFLDMFDGKVARRYVTQKKDFIFGELTDSLCDAFNFGAMPALLFIYFFKDSIIICTFVVCLFLWSGIFRLARFSRDKKEVVKVYTGLPITVGGPLASLLIILTSSNILLCSLFLVIISFIMISNIKVKKI